MTKQTLLEKLKSTCRNWTDRRQQEMNHLSPRTLWICWGSFVLIAAFLLSWLLVFSWKKPGNYLSVEQIHVPVHVLPLSPEPTDSIRRALLFYHLQHLFYQVESLRTHPNTRYLYDSLVRQYPGIWDSLVQTQSLFLHPFTIKP